MFDKIDDKKSLLPTADAHNETYIKPNCFYLDKVTEYDFRQKRISLADRNKEGNVLLLCCKSELPVSKVSANSHLENESEARTVVLHVVKITTVKVAYPVVLRRN